MAFYYKAKGSVGYSTVGTPTIANGIASNFSGTSYLLTNAAQTEETSSFEWNFKFNTGTLSTDYASYVLGCNAHAGIYLNTSKAVRVTWINSNSGWVEKNTNYTLLDDTTYTVNLKVDNATSTGVITIFSESGSVLFTETYTNVTCRRMNSQFWIGMRGGVSYTDNYWRGSVYLNESYIAINGQPWFGLFPVAVNHIQLRGPNGYTVIGSPTISNGIVSGFSASDYLQFWSSSFPQAGMKTYESFVKFTTGSDVNTPQGLWGSVNYAGAAWGFQIAYGRLGGAYRYIKQSDGTAAYLSPNISDVTLTANTTYYSKYLLDMEAGTLTIGISTDGTNFTENTATATDYASPQKTTWYLGMGLMNNSGYFRGSIDLNASYVKINGKLLYWHPRPVEEVIVNNTQVWGGI